MDRTEFHATVDRLAWSLPDPARAELKQAAGEYAACLAEECAHTPQWATDRAVTAARAEVAEDIARSIETLAVVPAGTAEDEARCLQARDDAATARRIGRTRTRQPEREAS